MARSNKKNSFVLYTDTRNLLDLLNDEQTGKLFKAVFDYVEDGEAPELDQVSQVVFTTIKTYLDRDRAKYEEVCLKRAEYGKKGGVAKATKSYQKLPSVADNENDSDNENDNDSDNEYIKPSKPKKHKYGTYQNVLLTDEDLEKLKADYPDRWGSLIEELSEGIELKGYKYKNHYLAIKKWANGSNKRQPVDKVPNQRNGYIDFL